MSYLPDVNTWLALVHERHVHHRSVMTWFDALQEEYSAVLCRITQMGLLRLLTPPAAMGIAVQTQRGAWLTYTQTTADFRVSFAHEPMDLTAAFERFSLRDEVSPNRWADAYLAAFQPSQV